MRNKPEPRPCIAALGEYPMGAPVEDSSLPISNLDNNEHWSGPSKAVQDAVSDAVGSSHLYPEGSARLLRKEIAETHNLDPGKIVCGNGSSELIALLCRIYCNEGDKIVVGRYSYMYFRTAAQIVGAEIVTPSGNRVGLNVDELLECVGSKTRIVFLDNPQNPVGDIIPATEVRRLHAKLPSNVLLVLDAAYAEYAHSADYEDGARMVEDFSNCVMLRTFSKIYGLAALRLGWSYAPNEITDLLHRVRQPNNLSSLSVIAARTALLEQSTVTTRLRKNREWRANLSREMMSTLGMRIFPSHTNFVLGRLPDNCSLTANEVDSILRKQGILVRSMAGYGLPDYLRVTVGEPEHILRFIKCMTELLAEASR